MPTQFPSTARASSSIQPADQGSKWARHAMIAPMALAAALVCLGAKAQEGGEYRPPPLFSGQGHKALVSQGVVEGATPVAAEKSEAPARSPSLRLDPVIEALAAGKDPATAAALATPTAPSALTREDVPWALNGENRPWTLHFAAGTPPGTLMLSLPSAREAKLMLPGMASDMASRARQTANRYFADAISSASRTRERQATTLSHWIENSARQAQRAAADPWQKYQFSVELHRELDRFHERAVEQSAPDLARIQADVVRAVGEVTPLMESMSNYELQMDWYNVLIQLKEGYALYVGQVQAADAALLVTIEDFRQSNPYVARPEGPLPAKHAQGLAGPAMRAPGAGPGAISLTPPVAALDSPPVRAPAAQAPTAAEASGSWIPGAVVGVLVLLFVAVLVYRIRKTRRPGGVANNTGG